MAYRRDRSPLPGRGALLALCTGATTLLLGTPDPELQAQEVPSPYDFFDHRYEASVGLQHWQTRTGRFDLGPASGTGPAGRIGFHVAGPIALEGFGSIVSTTRSVVEPRAPGEEGNGPQVVGRSDALLVTGEARVRFHLTGPRTWNDLTPYVIAGVGLTNDFRGEQEADEELEERDRFNFGPSASLYGGLGTQWHVGDRLLVQADLGVTAWRMGNPRGFQDLEGQGDVGLVDENEWLLNPGLSVTLGLRR